jgi:hypothetical protein
MALSGKKLRLSRRWPGFNEKALRRQFKNVNGVKQGAAKSRA